MLLSLTLPSWLFKSLHSFKHVFAMTSRGHSPRRFREGISFPRPCGNAAQRRPWPPHFWIFYITHDDAPVGRTPLDEWSARRRETVPGNTHNKQKSQPPAVFESTIPANEGPQTHAWNFLYPRLLTHVAPLTALPLLLIAGVIPEATEIWRQIKLWQYFIADGSSATGHVATDCVAQRLVWMAP